MLFFIRPSRYQKTHARHGVTLVELVVTLAVMGIIVSLIVPILMGIRRSWSVAMEDGEITQNARVLLDHMERHLTQAKYITDVSLSSDEKGFIQFRMITGELLSYNMSSEQFVRFGDPKNPIDLSGPVGELRFTCYSSDDLTHPTADVNAIRVVKIEMAFPHSQAKGRDRVWQTTIQLRATSLVTTGLDRGLIGYWALNEGTGLYANDSSGWGRHGQLLDMAGDEWITGVIGRGLRFYGIKQRVEVPVQVTGDFTLSCWVRTDQDALGSGHWSAGYGLMDADLGVGRDDFGAGIVDGYFAFGVGASGGGDTTYTSTSLINNGAWRHVAASFTAVSGNIRIYVDGHLETTGAGSSGVKDVNTVMVIGHRSIRDAVDPKGGLVGYVDDVRLYGRILADSEISQLAAELGEQSIHLAFDDGSGSMAIDSFQGYHGTLHNMSAAAWISGRTGTALRFDGVDDYVDIPRTVTDDFTLVFWIRTSETASGTGLSPWTDGHGLIDGSVIGQQDDFGAALVGDHVVFGIGHNLSSGTTLHSSLGVNDGDWYHVAMTRQGDSGLMIMYINGTENVRTTGPTGAKADAAILVLGGLTSLTPGSFFTGDLDDIRIYDRTLSATEVQDLFDATP